MCLQVKLVQHTYSCLFGTFLCNSGKDREDRHVQERTCSVWSLLRPANRTLRNMLYSSHSETVRPLFLMHARKTRDTNNNRLMNQDKAGEEKCCQWI